MGRRAGLLTVMVLLMGAVGMPAAGFKQEPGGAAAAGAQLTGRVTDTHSSPLPGVTVTIEGPGGRRRVVTDSDGEYRFDGLAPGGYAVTGELVGFATATKTAYLPATSSSMRLSFSLVLACIAEDIRIAMPHVVAIDEVLSVHPGPWNTSAIQTIVAVDSFAMTAVGSDYLVFLAWSEPMQHLVPYDPALNLLLPAGKIRATHPSVEELNDLSSEDSLRVLRHLAHQPDGPPPSALSLGNLTVLPDRLLPECAITPRVSERSADGKVTGGLWAALPISSNPWQGTDPVVAGQIHERMFAPPISDTPLPSRRELAMSRLKGVEDVVESYAAIYRDSSSGALTTVTALRFRDADIAARWWRQRSFHGMQSILEGAIVATVSGSGSPCMPVIAAHVRSVRQ